MVCDQVLSSVEEDTTNHKFKILVDEVVQNRDKCKLKMSTYKIVEG